MQYPHRFNGDGTIDAICPRCYATVVSARSEDDVSRAEAQHVCDPEALRYFAEARTRAAKPPSKDRRSQRVEAIEDVG